MSSKVYVIFLALCAQLTVQLLSAQSDSEIVAAFDSINDTQPLESATDPLVARGMHVPTEIVPHRSHLIDPFSVSENPQEVFSDEELKLLGLIIPKCRSSNADILIKILLPHSNRLPPSNTDFKLYKVGLLMIRIWDDERTPGLYWGTSVKAWKPLVQAKNPVYRYLALDGIARSIPAEFQQYFVPYPDSDPRVAYLSAVGRFELYQKYFEETDHIMLKKLYRELARVPLEANLEYLLKQLSRHERHNDHELIEVLRESIEYVQKKISSPPDNLPQGWNEIKYERKSIRSFLLLVILLVGLLLVLSGALLVRQKSVG